MKENYRNYLQNILNEDDIKRLQMIARAGSNTGNDISRMVRTSYGVYSFLNKYANYGLLRKMGVSYSDDGSAYYCISSDGLEFLDAVE